MRGSDLSQCKLTIEPHFAGRKFLISWPASQTHADVILRLGKANAAARIHWLARPLGGRMAARGARAASDAGCRLSPPRLGGAAAPVDHTPENFGRGRLRRGPQPGGRISFRRGTIRSTASTGS